MFCLVIPTLEDSVSVGSDKMMFGWKSKEVENAEKQINNFDFPLPY